MQKKTLGTIFTRTKQFLVYADDVAVLWHALEHIIETVKDNITEASQIDLTINASKAKFMINIMKYGNEPKETEINK